LLAPEARSCTQASHGICGQGAEVGSPPHKRSKEGHPDFDGRVDGPTSDLDRAAATLVDASGGPKEIVDESNDPVTHSSVNFFSAVIDLLLLILVQSQVLAQEEEELQDQYNDIGHNVQFGELEIQTSNIKVSFMFEGQRQVSISQISEHLNKDVVLVAPHFTVKVKEKSAASTQDAKGNKRTFFGGVVTITMDVYPNGEEHAHNTSVRLFGLPPGPPPFWLLR
jgi:hypothetical protein